MTDQEWEDWAKSVEFKADVGFRLARKLFIMLVGTVVAGIIGWHEMRAAINQNTAVNEAQDFHIAVTDKRVDETPGAPAPDPKAVIVEQQVKEIRE